MKPLHTSGAPLFQQHEQIGGGRLASRRPRPQSSFCPLHCESTRVTATRPPTPLLSHCALKNSCPAKHID